MDRSNNTLPETRQHATHATWDEKLAELLPKPGGTLADLDATHTPPRRGGFRCYYCGRSAKKVELEMDHLPPPGPLLPPFRLCDEDIDRLAARVEQTTQRMLQAANVTLGIGAIACGAVSPGGERCDCVMGHRGPHATGVLPDGSPRASWVDCGTPSPISREDIARIADAVKATVSFNVKTAGAGGGGGSADSIAVDPRDKHGRVSVLWHDGVGDADLRADPHDDLESDGAIKVAPETSPTPEASIEQEIERRICCSGSSTLEIVTHRAVVYKKAFEDVLADLRIAVEGLGKALSNIEHGRRTYEPIVAALAAIKTKGL